MSNATLLLVSDHMDDIRAWRNNGDTLRVIASRLGIPLYSLVYYVRRIDATAIASPRQSHADRVRPLLDVITDRRAQHHGWQRIADDLNLPLSPRQLRDAYTSLGGKVSIETTDHLDQVAIYPANRPHITHQRFR